MGTPMKHLVPTLSMLLFLGSCTADQCTATPLRAVSVHEQTLDSTVKIDASDGKGSGFAWDESTIVTASHVLVDAESFQIETHSGEVCSVLEAMWIESTEVAIVHVADCKLNPIARRPGYKAAVGTRVISAGHAMVWDWTVSEGIVSALNRDFNHVKAIQMDVPLNPGMSGGPVVDERGYLVGLNLGLSSPIGFYIGISFAVPVGTIEASVAMMQGSE